MIEVFWLFFIMIATLIFAIITFRQDISVEAIIFAIITALLCLILGLMFIAGDDFGYTTYVDYHHSIGETKSILLYEEIRDNTVTTTKTDTTVVSHNEGTNNRPAWVTDFTNTTSVVTTQTNSTNLPVYQNQTFIDIRSTTEQAETIVLTRGHELGIAMSYIMFGLMLYFFFLGVKRALELKKSR